MHYKIYLNDGSIFDISGVALIEADRDGGCTILYDKKEQVLAVLPHANVLAVIHQN